jgi:FdhD protein
LPFRKLGSFQYAAAFLDGEMKAFFPDVGRHNAVDKTIGTIVKTGVDCSRTLLASSGRQSAAEVIKVARVGIPVTVSMRGPIFSGVHAALKTGVTLCCFARGSRMNVYSKFERITFDH